MNQYKQQRIIVPLPNLHPEVALPRYLAIPLQLIIEAGSGGICTFELLAAGCTNASSIVQKLKYCGAQINSARSNSVDLLGRERKGIAHYTYHGWSSPCLDEPSPLVIGGKIL
tara:strand:- start:978 stop:1316 length:339 start_codon:yes stop_codon:yes gene_type:complete